MPALLELTRRCSVYILFFLQEVCNNYLAGKCRYGDNCRRQHEPAGIPQTNIPTE